MGWMVAWMGYQFSSTTQQFHWDPDTEICRGSRM